MTSLRGRLLVAAPSLGDPNFFRTVVLLLEHGDEGALGVVVNRASDTSIGAVLPAWLDVAAEPSVVFAGGPVATESAIGLGRGEPDAVEGWAPLFDGIGTVDLGREPDRLPVDVVRVFVGYAGWGAGQLEAEIAGGSWFVVDSGGDRDLFSAEPGGLWRAVLARQPGRLAWFAHFPADPAAN